MKKKIALIAAVALLLGVAGYGTWAALNATATAKNVITMGTVEIGLRDEIQKAGVDVEEAWEKFPDTLDIKPDDEVVKRVFIKNLGDSDCYVRLKLRMQITPPEGKEDQVDPDDVKITFPEGQDWTLDEDGYMRYNKILTPGSETAEPLLCNIFFDGKQMSNEYLGAKFDVLNIAQAVQSKNNTYDPANESVLKVQGWPDDSTVVEPEPTPEPEPEPGV